MSLKKVEEHIFQYEGQDFTDEKGSKMIDGKFYYEDEKGNLSFSFSSQKDCSMVFKKYVEILEPDWKKK